MAGGFVSLAVLGCLALWFLKSFVQGRETKSRLAALSAQHGCRPAPALPTYYPLGVDLLEKIVRADGDGKLMDTFLGFHRTTGWTFQNTLLGATSWGTTEPENLEVIMNSGFKDWGFGKRRELTFPMFGDGIFTQEGPAWKHSRELLRPQFVHSQYDNMVVFEEAIKDLFDILPKDGGVVDLQPFFAKLTLDTTTAYLFGESVRSLLDVEEDGKDDVGEQSFAQAFNTAQSYIQDRFRLGDLYWLINSKKFRKSCHLVHKFADQLIDRNLNRHGKEEENGKYVFLDAVAESMPNRDALRGQTVNILAAGRDTTSTLLSWIFFLLVRHPLVMQKLRKEITEATDSEELTRPQLRKMNYLQNIIRETLRLYPSVPLNTRTAIRDTILPRGGGPDGKSPILIPKNGNVAFSVYAMHRRADLYGLDAELFRPERWEEEMGIGRDKGTERWGYLPFNGGPRICLGMDFALTEAAYTVVRILQRYPIIELPEGEKVEIIGSEKQALTLVIALKEGCKVRLGP